MVIGILDKKQQELRKGIEDHRKGYYLEAMNSLERARNLSPILYRVHAHLALLAPRKPFPGPWKVGSKPIFPVFIWQGP